MFDTLKQGAVAYNLPSASFTLSASFGSEFYLDNQTLTTASKATIAVNGAAAKQQLTFWFNNVDYPYTLIDGYTTASIFSSSVGVPTKVDVQFDGTQWNLGSFKRLALDSEPTITQDPAFANLGLILDVDPTKFYALKLTGSSVKTLDNVVPGESFGGLGHAPTWDRSGWNPGVPALLMTGSVTPSDIALQFLVNVNVSGSNSTLHNAMSCLSNTWASWTIFVVFQLNQIASEVGLLMFAALPNISPNIYVYSDATDVRVAVYNDTLISADSTALGTTTTGRHIVDVSADGSGHVSGSLDGGAIHVCNDARPKTIGSTLVGGGWLSAPTKIVDQLNGKIARILIFNQNLSASDRSRVRTLLANKYGL